VSVVLKKLPFARGLRVVSFYGLAFAALASLGAVVSGIALTKGDMWAAVILAGTTDSSGLIRAFGVGAAGDFDAIILACHTSGMASLATGCYGVPRVQGLPLPAAR
jgi:hypothetical protein